MKKMMTMLLILAIFLSGSCALAEADPVTEAAVFPDLFASDEINRMLDENHEKVLAEGYSELRIPASLHGIPESAMTPDSWEVGRILLDAGYEVYVVGGCVRDFIMGRECVDIDLTTNATVEQQRELFGDALGTHESGERLFGYVIYPDENVDLCTYQNIPAAYAGLPGIPDFDPTGLTSDSVLFDSFQRDLTINALYYDMSNGDLVDFHDGIYHIREGILSTMTDADTTLRDDPPIALRAIRFKARYGYRFSDNLEAAMREHGVEYILSADPYLCYSNSAKMLVAGYSHKAVKLLLDYGLLDTIYPSLKNYAADPEYLAYLDRALPWLDQYRTDTGEDVHKYLAFLTLLQPVIDSRAESMDYDAALASVLEEQGTRFDMIKVGERMEEASLLCHLMKDTASWFLRDTIRRSWRYDGALTLLNIAALTDPSLQRDVAFWNQIPWAPEDTTPEIPLDTPWLDAPEEEFAEADEDVA